MDALTKAFLEWANRKGYDTAHAYNQNESRWMFLSPMTADVYEAWQAARTVPEGFVMVPKGMPTEYLELLESSDMKAIHKLVRKHAVDAMLDTEMLSAAPEVKK